MVIRWSGFVQVSNKFLIVYVYIFNLKVFKCFDRVNIALRVFSEAYFCTLVRGTDGEYGLDLNHNTDGHIHDVKKGSSADQQGIKQYDHMFSINKMNVVGEGHEVIEGLLRNSGSSVEIGVLKPKKFDANLRKFTYS